VERDPSDDVQNLSHKRLKAGGPDSGSSGDCEINRRAKRRKPP
jgi:hypothetical protein